MRCPLSKVIILSNTTPRAAARQFLQSGLVSASRMTSLSKPIWCLPEAISVLSKLAGGKGAALGPAWCPGFRHFGPSFALSHASWRGAPLRPRGAKAHEQQTEGSLGRKAEAGLRFLYAFSLRDGCSQECFGGVGFHRFPQERPGRS